MTRATDEPASADRQEPAGHWEGLKDPKDIYRFGQAWLSLLVGMVGNVQSAVLIMRPTHDSTMVPVATFPDAVALEAEVIAVVEAVAGRGVGLARDGQKQTLIAAFPYPGHEQPMAIAALCLHRTGRDQGAAVLRQMQWAGGWLQQIQPVTATSAPAQIVIDQIVAVLATLGFLPACRALVTGLAASAAVDRVSLVWFGDRKPRLIAVSNAADFNKRLSVAAAIVDAASEAMDQSAMIQVPAIPDAAAYVSRSLDALMASSGAKFGIAVPFFIHGSPACVLVADSELPLSAQGRALIVAAGAALAPALEEKRLSGASLPAIALRRLGATAAMLVGRDRMKLKLMVLAILLVVGLLTVLKADYAVVAEARLEGSQLRWIVAPYDGYLATVQVRPGSDVAQGDNLASLDRVELDLERLARLAEAQKKDIDISVATAKGDRSQVNQLKAELEYGRANIALLDANLARADLTAPFDAVVVSGDLTDRVGSPVKQGEKLFSLAPRGSVRVEVFVRDTNIDEMHIGQLGILRLTALPDRKLPITILSITPVTEIENGLNVFRVEAVLDDIASDLRPGMKGVARVMVDRRLLALVWAKPVLDWVQLALWRWWP